MAEYMAGNVDDYADGDRKVVDCAETGSRRLPDRWRILCLA